MSDPRSNRNATREGPEEPASPGAPEPLSARTAEQEAADLDAAFLDVLEARAAALARGRELLAALGEEPPGRGGRSAGRGKGRRG